MKLRTVLLLAGLGALAARTARASRTRPLLLLEPGPPVEPPAPPSEALRPTAPEPPAAGPHAVTPPPDEPVAPAAEPVAAPDEAVAAPDEVDGWPVPAVDVPLPAADAPPLPRVEEASTGWSVAGPEQRTPPSARVEDATVVVPPRPPGRQEPPPAVAFAVGAQPVRPASRPGAGGPRQTLLANEVPLVFMGATPLAMLGLDRIVGRLGAVSLHDCFDGRHGTVYVPRAVPTVDVTSSASVVNALLAARDVVDRLRLRPGRVVALAGDEETERLAESFGYAVALAPAAMRRRLGAASELAHLARDAGVRALPAATGHAGSYQELLLLARGLGTDLLVESLDRPGQPAAPIGSLEDWFAHERRLGTELLRVTRRVTGPTYALAGVVGAAGVVVSPVVADARPLPADPVDGAGTLVCDVASDLDPLLLSGLRDVARAVGARLAEEGFRGLFEVDLVADPRAGEGPLLTAIRPEGSATTILDAVSAIPADELPALALHVAAQLGDPLSGAEAPAAERPRWSVLVVDDTSEVAQSITEAPASGIWTVDRAAHGGIRYVRAETDWRSVQEPGEAFHLRVARAGTVCAPGGPLGVIAARGRLAEHDGRPTERAQQWVKGIRRNVWTSPAPAGDPVASAPPGLLVL